VSLHSLEQNMKCISLFDQIHWILCETFAAALWINKWMTRPENTWLLNDLFVCIEQNYAVIMHLVVNELLSVR